MRDFARIVLVDTPQRPMPLYLLKQVPRGDYLVEPPAVAVAHIHEFNEPHDVISAAKMIEQVEHGVVIDAPLYDDVNFDRRKTRLPGRLDSFQHAPKITASAAHMPENLFIEAVEANRDTMQSGVGKLLCVGDDQGLHDGLGLRERLGPQEALIGLESGELTTCAASYIELVRLGVREGLPAIHLLDGRMPHALVAELFTDQGVGTLVSRQDPLER